jgi:SPP1 family predicted phage head-tail adaptor
MRAGEMDRKVVFYAKVKTTSSAYGGTVDTWPTATITTWGRIQYSGGDAILSSEEKFYSGNIILTIRYRSMIVETMRVLIDSAWYRITYIERLGRKEGLRINLQRINE